MEVAALGLLEVEPASPGPPSPVEGSELQAPSVSSGPIQSTAITLQFCMIATPRQHQVPNAGCSSHNAEATSRNFGSRFGRTTRRGGALLTREGAPALPQAEKSARRHVRPRHVAQGVMLAARARAPRRIRERSVELPSVHAAPRDRV